MTAADIRRKIIEVVGNNGGHLASSLGAVEIAMALAEVFDPKEDAVIWDVGHQAYAWKILTGRDSQFSSIRKFGGLSPFPTPLESKCDPAVCGHAGVALSVAEGMASAYESRKTSRNVVAVIGDAAIANGTSFEALDNCASACGKVIIVLNDNEMSISKPRGSLSRMLAKLITGVRYNRIKAAAESAGHKMKLTPLRGFYHRIESSIKSWFLGNAFFERFSIRYIGPVDGHDLSSLKSAFTVAKEDKRSVIVHVTTKKGKGYEPAEKDPTAWHGVGPFSGNVREKVRDWSCACGEAIVQAARKDERVVALVAGMKDGTGLERFAREFPRRFYDVGIAEGHMVAFAAGLAAGGMKPVVAIYSTFLQRAVDQVMHDVAIASRNVVFCVDRAGVVGADGATHQGVFDIAMLRCLPNMIISQPADEKELKAMLDEALSSDHPQVIRYPRGAIPSDAGIGEVPPRALAVQLMNPDAKTQIWALGDQIEKARKIASLTGAGVVYARYIKPFDSEMLSRQRCEGKRIISLENGSVAGGFGEAIGADLKFGWPDKFICHGTLEELEKEYGFDAATIAEEING